MLRSDSITRIFLTLLFVYLFSFGATFNAALIPALSFTTLGVIGVLLIIWLLVRWRGGWHWHHTPLDGVFLLWALVFLISLLTNLESWRRSFIGLWYVGVYVGTWYVLYDAIANGVIKRQTLIDSILLSSVIVVLFGFLQISVVGLDFSQPKLPRLSSTVGNPNALGMFLLIVLMLVAGRLLQQKTRFSQIILGGYALILLFMLLLTFSRGVLLGLIAAGSVFMLLMGLRQSAKHWWQQTSRRMKTLITLAMSGTFIVGMIVTSVLIQQTLTTSDRNLGLRANIYHAAILTFAEQPITGHGLFTFGQELARIQSQPTEQPHSHAHNIILHIAAEQGIAGLIVLFVTAWVIIRVIKRQWQQSRSEDTPVLAGAIAAVVGFGVTHLFDIPSMMPLIALMGILTLILTMSETQPVQITAQWRIITRSTGMIGLWFALLASGLWSTSVYAQYNAAIVYGITEGDYRGAAERLQSVVNADPGLALYHNQQAYLYGLAADIGDSEALVLGIAAYDRYLALEPQDAIAWMNQGALLWQAGQQQNALDAMQMAHDAAELSWQIRFNHGLYAEAVGEKTIAIERYKRTLRNSFNLMFPQWEETAFRRQMQAYAKPTRVELIVLALDDKTMYANYAPDILWERSGLPDEHSTRRYVLQLLVALWLEAPGQYSESQFADWLNTAANLVTMREDQAWVHLGRSALLLHNGVKHAAQDELQLAYDAIAPDFAREDYKTGLNIAHFQFLRFAITRQFLPQVNYPTVDTLPILRLLAKAADMQADE